MAESKELAICQVPSRESWLWRLFKWSGSSDMVLRSAEKKILSYLKTAYRGWFVDIGPVVGTSDKIWTISLNQESQKTPVVLLHGLGAGVALWLLNLDALAKHRPVYAIDILGFGRSSRPAFSQHALEAEKQLVQSVEEWRKEMQLEKCVFVGHSFGGYLAVLYTIQYPERVKHLILAEPWGLPEKPPEAANKKGSPLFIKALSYVAQTFNPLWAVRLAGPFGTWLIETTRPDIVKKYASVLNDDVNCIAQYIHQCNVQTPSGESAFRSMMHGLAWAKNPIVNRINQLHPDIPITLLYGNRSWVDNSAGNTIKQIRPSSYVNIQTITGAGHHVFLDKSETFNKHVIEACALSEKYPKLTRNIIVKQDLKSSSNEQTESEGELDENKEISDKIVDTEKPKLS